MPDSDVQVTFGADASGVTQGVGEAKSAIANFAPQIDALAKSFSSLAGQVKEGFEGVKSLANGLDSAAAGGLKGLAGIVEAGAGAAGVVAAVGEAALAATSAMAEWASSTLTSSSASAEAKQNAADLNNAFGQAQSAFKNAGDTIANALAPALTQLVGGIADVVQKAVDFYNGSAVLKTGLDWLIAGLKATFVPIMALGEAFVQAWIMIKGAWAQMQAKWTLVQDVFNAGCDAIKASFKSLALAIGDAIAGNWVDAARQAMQGVGQAASAAAPHTAKIRADLTAIDALKLASAREALQHLAGFGNDVAGMFRGPAHSQVPSGAGPPRSRAGGSAQRAAAVQPAIGSDKSSCECDPAAAIACEAAAQFGSTAVAAQGNQQRAADHVAANAAMGADDSAATAGAARDQAQQVTDAENADRAKVQSNTAANRQIAEANDKTLKQFQSSMNRVVDTFASGLVKMAEGTESFGQVIRKVGQQILDDIFRVVIGMVEKWVWGETEKVLATQNAQALLDALGLRAFAAAIMRDQATARSAIASEQAKDAAKQAGATQGLAIDGMASLKEIANSAATAAGHAYQAMAGIPVVGPALGAAAAAAVFGAVIAFKGLVLSAAGGYDIPAGINPLTQLHAQEMVLPARLANPMRDMLASFGSNGAPAASGHSFSFGDTHIHGAPNMSPSDFKQALAEHRANVAEAVANALHGGWRPSYRQPVGAL